MGPGGDVARVAALQAGLGVAVPALTVDRQCASGLAAVVTGAAGARASGPASSSPAASSRRRRRRGGSGRRWTAASRCATSGRRSRRGHRATLTWGWPTTCGQRPRGEPGGAGRRTPPARTPVPPQPRPTACSTPSWCRSGGVDRDDRPRAGLTAERLARLPAGVPPGRSVTAGNSCGVNDGAAAVALVDAETHRRTGAPGLRVLATGHRGVRPRPSPDRGLVPADAVRARPGRRWRSTTSTWWSSTRRSPGRCWRAAPSSASTRDGVCPEGGALALGHPWGASGARAPGAAVLAAGPRRCRWAARPRRDRGRRRPGGRGRGGGRAVIEVEHVSHSYGDAARCCADVSVRLPERRVGVIGANGSGKSTFVAAPQRAGAARRGAGAGQRPRHPAATAAAVRRQVGFCFTNPDAQIVMPTVREDVGVRAAAPGAARADAGRAGHRTSWRGSSSPTTPTTPPTCSPAARSSCSRWPRCS